VNHAVSAHAWLAVPMSLWYASLHYLVTPAVLVWIYLRRPDAYSRARTSSLWPPASDCWDSCSHPLRHRA
jgi:hypothetical protein